MKKQKKCLVILDHQAWFTLVRSRAKAWAGKPLRPSIVQLIHLIQESVAARFGAVPISLSAHILTDLSTPSDGAVNFQQSLVAKGFELHLCDFRNHNDAYNKEVRDTRLCTASVAFELGATDPEEYTHVMVLSPDLALVDILQGLEDFAGVGIAWFSIDNPLLQWRAPELFTDFATLKTWRDITS